MTCKRLLETAPGARSAYSLRALSDDRAESCDADLTRNGDAAPACIAAAPAARRPDEDASLSACDQVPEALRRAGPRFAVSINDRALPAPAFAARVTRATDEDATWLVLRAHGDHILHRDLKAVAYLREKT